jgi:hypothetical protein
MARRYPGQAVTDAYVDAITACCESASSTFVA